MRALHAILIPATVALLGVTACRSMGASSPQEQPSSDSAILRVTNDNFSDIEVFIVRSGLATRIGRVSAGSTQRFTLTPTLLGPSDVTFIATPTNGSGRGSSGSLVVLPGRTVDFRINALIGQSSATVQ